MKYIKYAVILSLMFTIAGCSKGDDEADREGGQAEETTSNAVPEVFGVNTDFVNGLYEDAYEVKYYDVVVEGDEWSRVEIPENELAGADFDEAVFYDERSNRVAEIRWSSWDKKIDFILVFTTNDRGLILSKSSVDINGRPIGSGYFGIHRREYEYDEHGNTISDSTFGVDGKPVLDNFYIHRHVYEYDKNDNLISERNYGTDGEPVVDELGSHHTVWEYDENGNRISGVAYGIDDEPGSGKFQHRLEYLYDDGEIDGVIFYDVNGNDITREIEMREGKSGRGDE